VTKEKNEKLAKVELPYTVSMAILDIYEILEGHNIATRHKQGRILWTEMRYKAI